MISSFNRKTANCVSVHNAGSGGLYSHLFKTLGCTWTISDRNTRYKIFCTEQESDTDALKPDLIEATWGADPLENTYQGFRSLERDDNARFPSSLAKDGLVSWSSIEAEISKQHPSSASSKLTVGFPNIDWASLRSVYGWAALQYQAWARGYLVVSDLVKRQYVVNFDHVLEFWIDQRPYFGGDFYAYRNAPLVLLLEPGRHRIEVRLIRDVRAMGGDGDPTVDIMLHIQRSVSSLAIDADKLIVPDIVDRKLASTLACVPVRNEGAKWIEIWTVESVEVSLPRTVRLQLMYAKGQLYYKDGKGSTPETSARSNKTGGLQVVVTKSRLAYPTMYCQIQDRRCNKFFL